MFRALNFARRATVDGKTSNDGSWAGMHSQVWDRTCFGSLASSFEPLGLLGCKLQFRALNFAHRATVDGKTSNDGSWAGICVGPLKL